MKNKIWTNRAANDFGPGYELEGKFYKGKEIGSLSTRKYIVCKDGTKVERKGTRIDFKIDDNQFEFRKVIKC